MPIERTENGEERGELGNTRELKPVWRRSSSIEAAARTSLLERESQQTLTGDVADLVFFFFSIFSIREK